MKPQSILFTIMQFKHETINEICDRHIWNFCVLSLLLSQTETYNEKLVFCA